MKNSEQIFVGTEESRLIGFDLSIVSEDEGKSHPTVSHWWEIFIDQVR